jgi:hypothetical protein
MNAVTTIQLRDFEAREERPGARADVTAERHAAAV